MDKTGEPHDGTETLRLNRAQASLSSLLRYHSVSLYLECSLGFFVSKIYIITNGIMLCKVSVFKLYVFVFVGWLYVKFISYGFLAYLHVHFF